MSGNLDQGAPTQPVVHLSRRYRFSAMHRLHLRALSAEQNRALFGKCNNPYGHGHNYVLQVSLRGAVDAETGMVVNVGDMDAYVRSAVLERFDRADLNADPAFARCVPSTEKMAHLLWELLLPYAARQQSAQLYRVRLEETSNNAFDYYGPRST